ncbi:kinase-like domain-containing protein [Syncephalastrum racemosum]|uniref:cAMP-dependent protein kinase n=1 Tax=Syncephalastrum racemosum TaxID=13706 RepID=A0A1X2HES7_SYNRA|nr:kinase-like domain-containing protein [Syncephalastrum racemosum]
MESISKGVKDLRRKSVESFKQIPGKARRRSSLKALFGGLTAITTEKKNDNNTSAPPSPSSSISDVNSVRSDSGCSIPSQQGVPTPALTPKNSSLSCNTTDAEDDSRPCTPATDLSHPPALSANSSKSTTDSSSPSSTRIAPPPPLSELPDRKAHGLDDYAMKHTLGTGNFGRVHLARSKFTGRYCAIKTLKKEQVVKLRQTKHINNEQAILNNVNHPFLVDLWDTFQDDTHLFFVMEYIPGGEMFRILRQQKRFNEDAVRFYAAEVIMALEYLHKRDIAYRDLKPENILLDADGHVKLVDFGFAKEVPDITWTVCGTPDYLAPEIIRSQGYGKAVDWWGLGVLIYEMLVGRPPFTDKNPVNLYEKILDCRVDWSDHISVTARDLLRGLLTSDISKRYGNLKNGSRDIKNHPFFEGIVWDVDVQRHVIPPFKPEVQHPGDTTCFEKYEEPNTPYGEGPQLGESYRTQFPAF